MDPVNADAAIDVVFDPTRAPGNRVTVSKASIDVIARERGTVTFMLKVRQGPGAEPTPVAGPVPNPSFPSNPIQWVDNATDHNPIDPPSVASVSRSETRLTIEISTSPRTETYSFFIIVQTSDGRFFGTDPTIVTMRPGDGG